MSLFGETPWYSAIDPRIWQAVIAGAFVSVGWLVNGWQNRRSAAHLRKEKLRDFHRAIHAEIGTNLANLWDEKRLESYSAGLIEKMREDDGFIPFIPRERNDFTYDALIGDIHILPRQTIDPIVVYYSQIKSIAALADDMRGAGFKAMAQDRRIAMYGDYIEMKKQALQFGRYANAMIVAFSDGGAPGAHAEARRFNTRAAVRSGPSQE
jgi:hypothetical protein